MAKDLPYFKFFCSEWSDGDITLESFETQGLFINICAYYWSNECSISLDKTKKKFKLCNDINFENLINSGIIKIIEGNISINFLNEQQNERSFKSLTNSENGKKGGRPKKPIESEIKPNALFSLSEPKANTKAIREEKKREEEIRKENNNDRFYSELIISESWIESTAMHSRQKLIPIEVKRFLKQYNDMINLQFEIKINKTQYCTHFINWLNKQEKKSAIKKPSLL